MILLASAAPGGGSRRAGVGPLTPSHPIHLDQLTSSAEVIVDHKPCFLVSTPQPEGQASHLPRWLRNERLELSTLNHRFEAWKI